MRQEIGYTSPRSDSLDGPQVGAELASDGSSEDAAAVRVSGAQARPTAHLQSPQVHTSASPELPPPTLNLPRTAQ